MAARQKFTLVDDETLTMNVLSPHRVARVQVVYPSAETFTLTVDSKPDGNTNAIRELNETVTAGTTLIWTPDNLWVRPDDQLIFTNTISDAAEVTIEYVKDDDV